jgi:hypothetical protein
MHADRLISEIHGVSIFRGTNCLDGDEWTLDQAARAEAYSRQCAINSRMQTTVSPSNGVWASWDSDHDVDAKAEFDSLLDAAMEHERATSA